MRPQNPLKVATTVDNTAVSSTTTSSAVTGSVKSSPASSIFRRTARPYGVAHSGPSSPELTSLPQFPSSPAEEGQHASRKGFMPSLRSRKSSASVRGDEKPTIRHVQEDDRRKARSPDHGVPASEEFDLDLLNAQRYTAHLKQPKQPKATARLPAPPRINKEMPPLPVENRSEIDLASTRTRPKAAIPFSASTRNLPSTGAGLSFFGRVKATSSKATDGIRKAAAKINVKKTDRSGSASARGSGGRLPYEDKYEPQLLILPLADQTRITRPRQLMHQLPDPASFWLPALPQRCLQFLEARGCQEEGLYRVNGAVPVVRYWYQRFDQEGDVDLLSQDIPDINSIGSLLKQWLRELPAELLPKAVQVNIKRAHPEAREVPQLMVDELSKLSPWSYHLLKAITGHLSKLIRAERTTRMSFEAVRTCMPGLKIDSHILSLLLTRWEDCWGGCQGERVAYQRETAEMGRLGLTEAQMAAAAPPPELDQVQPLSPIRADFA